MAQFCNQCGESLADGTTFCPKCGNQMNPSKAPTNNAGEAGAGGFGNKNNIIKIAIAVVAVLALVFIVKQFIGGGNKSVDATVKSFMNGLVKGDADKVLDCFPEAMIDELSSSEKKEFKANVKEYKEYFKELKFKITDKEEYDDEDLEYLQEEWEDYFKVKKAYNVEVEITMELLGVKNTDSLDLVVVKIGSKYYIISDDMF